MALHTDQFPLWEGHIFGTSQALSHHWLSLVVELPLENAQPVDFGPFKATECILALCLVSEMKAAPA
jgi:hypothetical protein